MKQTSVQERRKYDETFKREAVLNWLHSGKSAAVVGEELGVNANLLYSWRSLVAEIPVARAAAAKRISTTTGLQKRKPNNQNMRQGANSPAN
jgi:transposase-like protein